MENSRQGSFQIQAYTHKELAKRYGCDPRTLAKWLNEIKDLGPRVGNLYSPWQVSMIMDKLGEPSKSG
jgi:hypothetical protein